MFKATRKIVPKVVPKVIKHITPWYIRFIYSICGDRFKMASSSIVPEAATASDSVVCSKLFLHTIPNANEVDFFNVFLCFADEINGR